MPDSPRERMQRLPNRLHRPHAGQSLDPTLTRKGALAHPGSLLVGFGALVFFAYVFNVGGLQTWLDGLFSGLDTRARSHEGDVSAWITAALPYLGVALGAVVLFFVLSALGRGAKALTRRSKLRKREEVSLQDFVEAAAQHNVSKRVAREAYQLLLPHYDRKMRVTLSDRMAGTLRMRPIEVSDLYGTLLRNADRQRRVGDTGAQIDTVLDLLIAVEYSVPRSLSPSKMHQRANAAVRAAAAPAGAKDVSIIRPYRPEKIRD